jgi:DNA uptake protein ComE-like DNA-binding protein
MTTTTIRLATVCAGGALVLALAGCGGGGSTTSGGTAPAAPATSAAATGSAPTGAGKVSANTASEEEIAAALERAGVSNAEKWAEEVVEYRPYPADDENLTVLRENLAKYNPGQETTDKIVSALTP